ncbi:MAG: serine--tRNA ligase [Gammaproteobacteria bacterium]|nr:serine--tRNA ligase [Gammaproteobacteria bacterium]
MLDQRRLRQDPEAIRDALKVRGFELDIEHYNTLEAERRTLQSDTESLQNERNVKSKAIGKAKADGKDIKSLVAQVGDLGDRLDAAKARFGDVQAELDAFLLGVPNVPDASVPAGHDENDNEELRRCGEPAELNFEAKDHVDLAGHAMDFEAAVKIAGSRFVVMRGQLARMQRALTQFMLDIHTLEHGYEEIYVPYVANAESFRGTGQLPKFADDQFAVTGEEGFYLIPTAEVPVTNLVRDKILDAEDLPLRFVAHTPCFRREAGSYGKDTRGIIRQHQFEKVELVHIVHPDKSWEALEALTGHAEVILQRLELPYRAMVLCGGDLGFAAAKTIDLEVWLPGQGKYREIASCSNYLDFQARRLMARCRTEDGKPVYVHTLNGSGLAVGRTLVAVMENYQDGEGTIHVPDALRPYLGGAATLELGSG